MPPTKVQSKVATGGGSTPLVITLDSPTTPGNLLVASIGYRQPTAGGLSFSAADNKGNSFSAVSPPASTAAFNFQAAIHAAGNISGGASHQLTVTPSGTFTAAWRVCVTEFSGCVTASPFDKQSNTSGGFDAAPTTPATAALAQSDELVVGALYHGAAVTITEGAGYTRDAQVAGPEGLSTEYKTVSATAAVVANWSASGSAGYGAACATFKASAAPTVHTADANLTVAAATLTGPATASGPTSPAAGRPRLRFGGTALRG